MNAFAERCADLAEWGARTSLHVAVLAVVVLAVERAFGRWLSPRGRYALWLLVVVRLMLPALPELSFSLVPWRAPEAPASAGGPWFQSDVASTPIVPAALRAPSESTVRQPPARAPRSTPEVDPVAMQSEPREPSITLAATAPSKVARGSVLAVLAVLAWSAVAAALLLRDLGRELGFRARVRRTARAADEPQHRALLDDARAALGVRRRVELLRFDELRSPALSGWLRPRILIPARLLARLEPEQLAIVLRHELAHVRRGDVLVNFAVVLLRRLWWFHPIVHFALARLRSAQESARDGEALSSAGSPAPLTYARTLLELAQSGPGAASPAAIPFLRTPSDTHRRILMSAEFRPPRLAHGLLGAVLFSALGWLSLTSAAPRDATQSGAGAGLSSIAVERLGLTPPWRAGIEERLDVRVDVEMEEVPIEELVAYLREIADLNVVLDATAFYDIGYEPISMHLAGVRLRDVLDRLCEPDGLAWCIAREAVCIGRDGSLPEELDLRFYKVAPLLEDISSDQRGDALERLQQLVRDVTGMDGNWPWDRDGVWMESWDELLVVHQTDAMHDRTHAFLDRLLNRGSEPEPAPDAWRAELEARLRQEVALDVEQSDVIQAAAKLAEQSGTSIRFDQAFLDEGSVEEIALHLSDVSLATALSWLAHFSGTRVQLRPGEIVLGRELEVELAFYEVGDLFGTWEAPSDEELRERVESTMRHLVFPSTWDESPACLVSYWRDQMLVVQCPEAQEQIAALLEAVRRATRP